MPQTRNLITAEGLKELQEQLQALVASVREIAKRELAPYAFPPAGKPEPFKERILRLAVLGKDHLTIVEALVNAGADTEIKDRQGMTALAHARARGYTDMIKILEVASGRKT